MCITFITRLFWSALYYLILTAVPKELRMKLAWCKSFVLMMPQMAIYGGGQIYFTEGNFPKLTLDMQPFYISPLSFMRLNFSLADPQQSTVFFVCLL